MVMRPHIAATPRNSLGNSIGRTPLPGNPEERELQGHLVWPQGVQLVLAPAEHRGKAHLWVSTWRAVLSPHCTGHDTSGNEVAAVCDIEKHSPSTSAQARKVVALRPTAAKLSQG